MSNINKVRISEIDYDIIPSPSTNLMVPSGHVGYTSNDVDQASATSYVSVNKINITDNINSIFEKITSMIRNTRFIYNKLGTTDISGISNTITGAITTLNTALSGKAAASHSHSTGDLPISKSQTNSDKYIPTSSLVYSMNQTLTSLNDIKPSYGTTDIGTGSSLTTGKIYCVYES